MDVQCEQSAKYFIESANFYIYIGSLKLIFSEGSTKEWKITLNMYNIDLPRGRRIINFVKMCAPSPFYFVFYSFYNTYFIFYFFC